jgi:hypothetical protein
VTVTGITNIASRALFGEYLDRRGFARTMPVTLAIQAIALGLFAYASTPWGFVGSAGLLFLVWG